MSRPVIAGLPWTADGHPVLALLLELHAGHLTPAQAEDVHAHLETCQVCRELVLDFARFEGGLPAGEEPLSEQESAEEWVKLERAIALERSDDSPSRVLSFEAREPRKEPAREADVARTRIWQVLAAAFFLAAVGLGVWGYRVRDAQTVEVDVFSVEDSTRGPGEDRRALRPASRAPRWLLLIHLPVGVESNVFSASIQPVSAGSSPPILLRKGPLTADDRRIVRWTIQGDLEPGDYVLRLVDATRDRVDVVAEYEFSVSAEPDP